MGDTITDLVNTVGNLAQRVRQLEAAETSVAGGGGAIIAPAARGDMIAANAVPAWALLPLAGANGSFMRRTATDPAWSALVLPNAAVMGDVLYATGPNAIGNLADVAVGSVLVSGGIGAAPSYSTSPTLTGLTLSGLTPSTVIYSNAARAITSLANAAGYLYNNGAGALSWAATAAPTAHNLLSISHGDTVVNGATRGSLVYGNSTPAWDELVLGGAPGSIVIRDAADVLWSAFYLAGTAAQTYTFPAAGGTVALLNAANAFTNNNTLSNGMFLTCLTDGSGGGLRAGSGSDVLWYRGGADYWQTPDSVTIDARLSVGTALSAVAGAAVAFTGAAAGASIYGVQGQSIANNTTDYGIGGFFRVQTAAAVFTLTHAMAVYVANPIKGATSTITNAYGVYIAGITSGLNNWGIYELGAAPNHFDGEVRVQGDTGGEVGTIAITGTSNLVPSTGVGSILMCGATDRYSVGFIKFYIGVAAYFIPVFSVITG